MKFVYQLVLAIVLLPSLSLGQESTSMTPAETDSTNLPIDTISLLSKDHLMIVPFQPKMYMSDVDRDVGKTNNIDFYKVMGFFRLGLDNALVIRAKEEYEVITMHADVPDINRDLNYIYKSIGYDYELVPVKDEMADATKAKKIMNKFKKKEAPKTVSETKIDGGQVVSEGEMIERYMSTKVINPNMLSFLTEKYKTNLYLFINQLDIKNSVSDYRDYESDNFSRVIQAHYTLMDADGHKIAGGKTKEYFNSNTNDIRVIIKDHFTALADSMLDEITGTLLLLREAESTATEN